MNRTQLEAEAYASHIAGLHLLEHPERKPEALAKLQRAQYITLLTGNFETPICNLELGGISAVVTVSDRALSHSLADSMSCGCKSLEDCCSSRFWPLW